MTDSDLKFILFFAVVCVYAANPFIGAIVTIGFGSVVLAVVLVGPHWRAFGIGLGALFLLIAVASVLMRNPVAGRIILVPLALYAIFKRRQLVRWWRTNADHQPLRTVRRIGMFYVFWGLLWGLLSPWTGLGSPWTVVPVFAVLIVITALKSRQMLRWWRAWDERGRPIDIDVLPDAKVTRR